jgi:hypothetical protein
MTASHKKLSFARWFAILAVSFAGLCLLLAAVSLAVNAVQPQQSTSPNQLTSRDKARLAEVFHLRQALGDNILPGWSQAAIPVIAFNEQYLFLVGSSNPDPGWVTVPGSEQKGSRWQPVPDDDFYGQVYYRQPLPASGETTENFTVRVGEDWVASLMALEWMKISLAQEFRQDLPALLRPVFPYSLVVGLFIPGSETYITAVQHEALHAYQGIRAPAKLAAAEQAGRQSSRQYPWEDSVFRSAWQTELDLLNQAVRAEDEQEAARLARAFLEHRAQRRAAARLSGPLVAYERQREWVEGVAKYAELSIYRQAAQTKGYQPVPELSQDPAFRGYRLAQQKWDQETAQIRRMAGSEGDGRFYYSGFAQAVLLDQLSPGWKELLFDDNVWLENLLNNALETR